MRKDFAQIIYFRNKNFKKLFHKMTMFQEKYIKNELDNEQIMFYFENMQKTFTFLYRNYRDILRKEGVYLIFPTDIFKKAKSMHLIENIDIWFNFIGAMNVYYLEKDVDKKFILIKKIINIYYDKFKQASLEIEKLISKDEILKYKNTPEDNCIKEKVLSYNKVYFDNRDLKISDRSYKILIDYFKSKKCIKNVWLYGSRLYQDLGERSDIDLIIDCSISNFYKIKRELNNLNIPYFTDCKNLYIKENQIFITKIIKSGLKKIYSFDDMQTFWDTSNKITIKPNIANIIKY